MNANIFRTEQL